MIETWLWVGFIVFIVGMLALDLGVLNRKAHVVRAREALLWTTFCVVLALGFTGVVYFLYERGILTLHGHSGRGSPGHEGAVLFLTGWLIEQSLSLDNIFVIAVIFSYFGVPAIYQHRVLFWGILGALVMRGVMIGVGAALIARFTWITYVFGAFLLLTAVKMARAGNDSVHPERSLLVRLARRLYPVSPGFDGERFFTRVDGRRAITPLFLVLLVVESTDVIFAVDSIPAIFAVTSDPFLVFTSNVFAILNLRSLYFVLANLLDRFRYLKPSLVVILAYVGLKMMAAPVLKSRYHFEIPPLATLSIVAGILLIGIIASALSNRRASRAGRSAAGGAAQPAERAAPEV